MLALQAAAANEPADIHELRQEAERAYKDRDAEGAQLLFLQLAEDFPDDPEVWFGLSRAYEWSGEPDQAIDAAEQSNLRHHRPQHVFCGAKLY